MINQIKNLVRKLPSKNADLNYGRHVIVKMIKDHVVKKNLHNLKILDIGCGKGVDLKNVESSLKNINIELFGIESYEPNVKQAREAGIKIYSMDVEREAIPTENAFFDIIIANQLIEHTKDIFWIFSEVSRSLKPEGIFVIGVPNLASLHNRFMLLFGEQPTSIEVLGPHVRGFTVPSFKRFIECDGYFIVKEVKGSNFYPFSRAISKPLSKIFPTLSVSIFLNAQRTEKKGLYIKVLDTRFFETPFYKGEETKIMLE